VSINKGDATSQNNQFSYNALGRLSSMSDTDGTLTYTLQKKQDDGSLLYRKRGSLNGHSGYYEIAVNPDTGTIFHRNFKGD